MKKADRPKLEAYKNKEMTTPYADRIDAKLNPVIERYEEPAPTAPKQTTRDKVAAGSLDDKAIRCKDKPKDNKPKRGGGSGRNFVPWC